MRITMPPALLLPTGLFQIPPIMARSLRHKGKKEDMQKYLELFLSDTHIILSEAQKSLHILQGDTSNYTAMAELRRAFHSLRSTASIMHFKSIADLCLTPELLLRDCIEQKKHIADRILHNMEQTVNTIREKLRKMEENAYGKKKKAPPFVVKRVLIAEDDNFIANLYRINLEDAGMSVTVTHNGKEAIDALQKEKHNLLLLDLMMPNMDGFAVLEWIRKKGYDIPVIVLTNLRQELDHKKCKKMGAAECIVKSDIEMEQVVTLAKKYIGK